MDCIRRAHHHSYGISSARLDELRRIYEQLLAPRGGTRHQLSQMEDRSARLSGARRRAVGADETSLVATFRLQRLSGHRKKDPIGEGAPNAGRARIIVPMTHFGGNYRAP